MILKAAIGLCVVALLMWMGAEAANAGRTMDIEELRLKLASAKAQYKGKDAEAFGRAIDNAVATLRAQYGTQVPTVEAIKLLRKLSIPDSVAATVPSQSADATGVGRKEMLAGLSVEFTPDGFLLRASDRSIVTGLFWVGLAVLLSVLPFRLFPDLIRGWWTDAGLSFWMTSAFLAVWAAGALYMVWMGALGFFGEIRISKSGDSGEIFTGIGKLGRTRRVRWSEYYGAGDRAVATSSSRSARTEHFIGLNGRSSGYRFGSELNAHQQAFVIAFLREHVFGLVPTPADGAATEQTAGDGKTVSVEHIRQTLEKAKQNYHGGDPEAFSRAADELVASLKARYGDQAPMADAIKSVEALGRMSGAEINFTF